MTTMPDNPLCTIDLVTILITMGEEAPTLLTLNQGQELPSGPLTNRHSLQKGLHRWAEQHTGCSIGHMEQLYTFADQPLPNTQHQLIRISYLALARITNPDGFSLQSLYTYFPWEDRRTPATNSQFKELRTHITSWARHDPERLTRTIPAFGLNGLPWDDEKVLDRYELLWEAGLVAKSLPTSTHTSDPSHTPFDNRRILATALSRLRAKIRYTPIVFELLPHAFTLLQLQKAMENLSGRPMHKPNFRRLVLHQKLVEETGERDASAPGRPAKLYRFRPEAATSCYLSGAMLPLD
ncbi:hypothetical protein GS535_00245 [Saccharibacter sp. EH611]|nr:hypothetical protein [Saccharibacter sp. EH611]MXV57461.1 hypothetical protein [Saccharibacter sp. EH70]MXV64678.1 hypothetical protein [Saccharibacter sp. EH60]